MVKGITKQVVVVNGTDTKLFEQAIFLIKDSALKNGCITEEALLQEAKIICKHAREGSPVQSRIFWALMGILTASGIWCLLFLI